MKKAKKIFQVIRRKLIHVYRYFATDRYMDVYTKYLTDIGVKIVGGGIRPKYIDPSVDFDGVDYSMIEIGTDTVISKDVLILVHDYSISRGMQAIGKYEREIREVKGVSIGENSFVGARCVLLPGTKIGNNCIIGAGAVVKGTIPDDSVVIGNPAKVVGNTEEWATRKLERLNS